MSSTCHSAHIICCLLLTCHALADVQMRHIASEPCCLRFKANYAASKPCSPTTTCMQHTSRCDHFSFASFLHNSAPIVAAHFLHSPSTATALFLSSSGPLIQPAPVPTCPNMHTYIAYSIIILEVQSCLVVELVPKRSRAPEGALCLHYGGLWCPW